MTMKKCFLFCVIVFLSVACGKLSPAADPADAFVGNYSYTDSYYVRWGGDSKSSSLNGTFTLTKISANQVQMSGAWSTIGNVIGNTVSFGTCPQTDSQGYVNYTFGSGSLTGNTLTFSYVGYGSIRFTNGVSYPWESSGNVIAKKLD